MNDLSYYELYRKDPGIARLLLVTHWQKRDSIAATARHFKTTRNSVRKAIKRYKSGGEKNLGDISRRPKNFYRKTPDEIEEKVLRLRKKTNFGALRLSGELEMEGLDLSPSTIGNILRRHGISKPKKKKSFVSKWVNYYEGDKIYPLQHFQVDLKEILDFKTLPKDTYFHILELGLPKYQWTAIDVKTRMRFLAYSHEKSFANGVAFMILLILWLHSLGISREFYFQTDWGEEFGGKSVKKINRLQDKTLTPLEVQLVRIPKGKKEYNGMVERSHRTDDEEFYIPYIPKLKRLKDWTHLALWWLWYYNVKRRHYGKGMKGSSPYLKLKSFYPWAHQSIALFPPVLLDNISTHPAWRGGQYVLDKYN